MPAGDESERREVWTETIYIERDGERVPVTISNEPAPGTPRRIYFFAKPPESVEKAASIAKYIDELDGVLDEAVRRQV